MHLNKVFVTDGGDVKKQLEKYTEQMDHMVEEALRLNVKWSLQELSRAINSDGKSSINPLFKVKVVLTSQVLYIHMYVLTSCHTCTCTYRYPTASAP